MSNQVDTLSRVEEAVREAKAAEAKAIESAEHARKYVESLKRRKYQYGCYFLGMRLCAVKTGGLRSAYVKDICEVEPWSWSASGAGFPGESEPFTLEATEMIKLMAVHTWGAALICELRVGNNAYECGPCAFTMINAILEAHQVASVTLKVVEL